MKSAAPFGGHSASPEPTCPQRYGGFVVGSFEPSYVCCSTYVLPLADRSVQALATDPLAYPAAGVEWVRLWRGSAVERL